LQTSPSSRLAFRCIHSSGRKLMMIACNKNNPQIKLSKLANASEVDEQEGYSFIFSGAIMAVRNP
jgi:hypothetical protein